MERLSKYNCVTAGTVQDGMLHNQHPPPFIAVGQSGINRLSGLLCHPPECFIKKRGQSAFTTVRLFLQGIIFKNIKKKKIWQPIVPQPSAGFPAVTALQ